MEALTNGSFGLLKGNLNIINISNLSLGKSIPSQNVFVPNNTELEYCRYSVNSKSLETPFF